jgi:hypothetical protein
MEKIVNKKFLKGLYLWEKDVTKKKMNFFPPCKGFTVYEVYTSWFAYMIGKCPIMEVKCKTWGNEPMEVVNIMKIY